jgi:hypothetical protein
MPESLAAQVAAEARRKAIRAQISEARNAAQPEIVAELEQVLRSI